MHEHTECSHDLKFCYKCDVVYCEKCKSEWRKSTYIYTNPVITYDGTVRQPWESPIYSNISHTHTED